MTKQIFFKYGWPVYFLLLTIVSLNWITDEPLLKAGTWRASIQRPDGQQIIFNFETKDSAAKTILYVINGNERLLVDSIKRENDSIDIQLPFFESGFRVKQTTTGDLEGVWIKSSGNNVQRLPFKAVYNSRFRFETTKPATLDIGGRWSAHFKGRNGKISELVGEFVQAGSKLTGTFLDPTGDYRFLEGVVSGDSLKLSGFDGGHAFLFTAKIENPQKISGGKFYSGAYAVQDWNAEKNDKAAIPDGYSSPGPKEVAGRLNFSFKNIDDGSDVSLADKQYQDKVVVLQILGSWCPNCMDETQFLSDYYKSNRNKGVEIIGIAYERTAEFERSQKALRPFKQRFNVQYPILLSGVAVSDSLRAEKTLPQLGKIEAFPTTVFIDKNGRIRKVHKGYSGPATGAHYEDFKKEFNHVIDELLREK